MNIDQINPLCSLVNPRLMKPFTDGYYTYASDGVICVRIVGKLTDNVINISVSSLPWDWLAEQVEGVLLTKDMLNDMHTEAMNCIYCVPGATATYCNECDGEGVIYHDTGIHEYEWECKSCGGDGRFGEIPPSECRECLGTRWGLGLSYSLGKQSINPKYLQKLVNSIPKIILHEGPHESSIIGFKFDGGDGMIMPQMQSRAYVCINADVLVV